MSKRKAPPSDSATEEKKKCEEYELEELCSDEEQPPIQEQERTEELEIQEHQELESLKKLGAKGSKMRQHAQAELKHNKKMPSKPYVSTQFSTTPDTKGKSDSKAKGSSTTAKSTERVEAKGSSIAVQERQSTTVPLGVFDSLRSMPLMPEGDIRFNKKGERYYEFNPSFEATIKIGGKTYESCADYLMQIYSSTDVQSKRTWRNAPDGAMEEALYAKFTQHKNLYDLLLSTSGHNLVYHIMSDTYWGDGGYEGGRSRAEQTWRDVSATATAFHEWEGQLRGNQRYVTAMPCDKQTL